MQGLLTGSCSSNYNFLLAERNLRFRRTDTASTWLTGSMGWNVPPKNELQCQQRKDGNYFELGLLYKLLFE